LARNNGSSFEVTLRASGTTGMGIFPGESAVYAKGSSANNPKKISARK
jgi:hypothetical protein